MLLTTLTELLGIKVPIQCGTMQWLSNADLVAAVAEAGGLACLAAATFPDKESLRSEIEKVKRKTSQPFGVNVSLFPSLTSQNIDQLIQTTIDSGVKILETSGRNPEPYQPRIKDGGLFHIHKCARLRDAIKMDKLGVDAISVVGAECGGHPGESALGTMVLIPEVVEHVSRPVIAGGGFCDGRTLVAGLALGADCVNMGTRFVLSKECTAHPRLKEFYQQACCSDTMIVMDSLRNSGRVLRTFWAERVKELEQGGAGLDELRPVINGAVTQKGWLQGTVDEGLYYCGQVVGRCQDLLSVREIIENMVAQAEAIIEHLRQTKEDRPA